MKIDVKFRVVGDDLIKYIHVAIDRFVEDHDSAHFTVGFTKHGNRIKDRRDQCSAVVLLMLELDLVNQVGGQLRTRGIDLQEVDQLLLIPGRAEFLGGKVRNLE